MSKKNNRNYVDARISSVLSNWGKSEPETLLGNNGVEK